MLFVSGSKTCVGIPQNSDAGSHRREISCLLLFLPQPATGQQFVDKKAIIAVFWKTVLPAHLNTTRTGPVIRKPWRFFFALVNSDWTSHSCTLTMSNLLMARFWLVWTEQPTNQNPPNCQNIILQLIWHDI